MGSAKVYSSNPQTPMAEDKKKITKIFKDIKGLFKKDKKKEKHVETSEEPKLTVSVQDVIENLRTLSVKTTEADKEINEFVKVIVDDSDKDSIDESAQFTREIIDDERRSERVDSQSSEDSGFADDKRDIANDLRDLKLDDDGQKKKKLQTVVITRAPVRNKLDYSAVARPYHVGQDGSCRQIHQVNKQIFSGGQVIENPTPIRTTDNLSEIELALKHVQETTKISQHENGDDWLLEAVDEIIGKIGQDEPQLNLAEFGQTQDVSDYNYNVNIPAEPTPNPIEEFTNINHLNTENDIVDFNNYDDVLNTISNNMTFIYPTPPHSEEVASPMSDSQASMYRQSDYTLSPERSSPIYNSDNEVFQEIPPVEFDFEYPVSVSGNDVEKPELKRDRTTSTGSIKKHMKQYKDLQKEISNNFSKKECCQGNKKNCKQIFQEYMQKIKKEERMSLCYKVTEMELKSAYGVLQHIILSLSQGSELEDLQHALFCLVCEKVMAQKPALFVGNFGLNLLKAAAMRCNRRPLFTRYLVQCVRTAVKNEPSLFGDKDSVFHEVDAQGDTLLIACARAGDSHADVLYELTRDKDQPLFRLEHVNADGLSALHVACSEHSACAPRLHTTHVLLDHAGADIWRGNMKSGDTALHLAVNSKSCDLHLVMLLFRHVDRKEWKKLAHLPNMCSKTPLEYAREATRSPLRQNHPYEVFEFLKKCRN
ncbi:uncharacterized protein LOC128682087 [Plodia interpunctella]|uniref:uncharacterized protein LOC128682087 n=1 Tax=Plodia interpunctella TaxID=58824 RepID=UPI002367ED5B|nr:uncharacterized protein LOC128682087 [Plodia interpunctella]